MPTTTDVRSTVADIVARLTGGDPDLVVPTATLRELGIDSLLTVELAEELGRRYDLYLSDHAVDRYRTVQDVIDSIVRHDGATAPGYLADTSARRDDRDLRDLTPSAAGMRRAVVVMALVGAAFGGAIGLGGSALLDAAGLSEAGLPPFEAASSAAPTTTTSSPEPSDEATPADPEAPQPSLATPKSRVAPGERFTLSGSFPGLESGTALQVQVKEQGQGWENFPVSAVTGADGAFETQVYTSRTGDREFRVLHTPSGVATPAVLVTIG